MIRSARAQRRIATLTAATLLVSGLIGLILLLQNKRPTVLERIERSGVLVVAMTQGQTSYHDGPKGPDGYEYQLVRQFANDLGVSVRYEFPPTIEALIDTTLRGNVHLAAGLTITAERCKQLRFSEPYRHETEHVVYRRGSQRPHRIEEIGEDELHVVSGSAQEAMLARLRATDYPELRWQSQSANGPEALLAAVDEGLIRYTVAGTHEIELNRRFYQHIAGAFELDQQRAVAWAVPDNGDSSLLDAIDDFIRRIHRDGRLQRIDARYFGHAGRLNFVETRDFWRNVRDRLPNYRDHFEKAGELTGIDWRLLAAIGYQESHWRPEAVSPTGVRGIMMLTQSTATQMQISDRADPEQSIVGGARYLREIENKIPDRIREPNRIWLTLAGYNVGFGHLEDARILTERDGASPDLWMEVKQRLPLLAKESHHKTLRHGFARGQEPVDYVDNIRNYYDLLVWYTTTKDADAVHRLLATEDRPPSDG